MSRFTISAAILLASLCASPDSSAQAVGGQSPGENFMAASPSAEMEGGPGVGNSAEGRLYAEGMRAINEGRWADAEAIFNKLADQHGGHADGALYWMAYAQNKQGQSSHALDICAELSRDYPSSSWRDECGALEIEIRSKSGEPVQPQAGQDDDLRLLALNSLMRQNEARAMAQISEILNGDSSQKLKDGAVFILGQHHSNATYPEIVRIGYVEGDVRIARGQRNERTTGAAWEKAVADIPVETGFSLVTGAGRAEIEFENASTLYLGENSVLTFNDLHTTVGVPYSELALLSGTVSLHISPFIEGERFLLRTPADTLVTQYPKTTHLRISSYMDAIAITALQGGSLRLAGSDVQPLTVGQTLYFRNGRRVDSADASVTDQFASWDKWVADRDAERSAAIAEVMEASGMSAPIPGLAGLRGMGTFFDCPPYGTCWEPAAAGDIQRASNKLPQSGTSFAQGSEAAGKTKPANAPAGSGIAGGGEFFPCIPAALRYRVARDPKTGKERVIDSPLDPGTVPYDWAVCHAGSWIRHNHRYVWVAGSRRHHLEPVRWVRSGHTVAYVPLHPYDVKDGTPVNRKNEVFAVSNKSGLSVERVKFDSARPIEYLKVPPREFREVHLPPLARAEDPRMEAHAVQDVTGIKGSIAKAAGIPISFDRKSQTFVMVRQVTQGGRSLTVQVPMNNRSGDLQGRYGGFSGGTGSRGGGSSRSSGSRGGGSSQGGGGSGGSSGGGSHTSGAGGSSTSGGSSAGSSSSGSSGAGSSGAGGSHH